MSDALDRHRDKLARGYKSDADAVREEHRFLWDEQQQHRLNSEQVLARQCHEQLHREYALADMTHYKEGAVGLRWRTEREVFDGRGQFSCGNKACTSDELLESFELNFAYVEHGERKQALVKLRVCPSCADKLHYRKHKEERRERRRRERDQRKEKRRKKRISSKRGRRERPQSRSRERDVYHSDSGGSEDEDAAQMRAGPPPAGSRTH